MPDFNQLRQPEDLEAEYLNTSYSGGLNLYESPIALQADEALELTNVDLSTPNRRNKLKDPASVITSFTSGDTTKPVYVLGVWQIPGATKLVMAHNGNLHWWDGVGVAATIATGAITINATAPWRAVQANSYIYASDQINQIVKFDGVAQSQIAPLDSTATAIQKCDDLLWFKNRLFVARGDTVDFSDVGAPETFSVAALSFHQGAGDRIVKMIGYRTDYVIVFKGSADGQGSIHLIDTSNAIPTNWTITPLFTGLNILSGATVVRMGNDEDSDIVFGTREGLRTLRFTSLDKLQQPSLPITRYLGSELDDLVWTSRATIPNNAGTINNEFCVVFDDNLIWFTVTTSTTNMNNVAFLKNLKLPVRSPLNGWVKIDTMMATSAVVVGFGTKPGLYFGSTTGGTVMKAFDSYATGGSASNYRETSRRINFGVQDKDKILTRLTVVHDGPSTGSVFYYIIYEDDETHLIAEETIASGGLSFPLDIPVGGVDFGSDTGLRHRIFDLHYDAVHVAMRRGKDFRIQILCTGDPHILAIKMEAIIENKRYREVSETITYTDYSTNQSLEVAGADNISFA